MQRKKLLNFFKKPEKVVLKVNSRAFLCFKVFYMVIRKMFLLLGCLGLLAKIAPSFAQNRSASFKSPEFIKASYILNLSQFVSRENKKPINNICIIGSDDLTAQLNQIVQDAGAQDQVSISSRTLLSDLKPCDILYIADTEEFTVQQTLSKIENKPILTISDMKKFIQRGGMIEFVEIDKNIKLHIHNTLARNHGLIIDPNLLDIAWRVK